ncbi:DUF1178 family protein [Rhodoferax sp. BAB1]|uniref:DUF1178 family protein n=1 Tax=Rhodoferax sp. BAB1 TaxID=2741720 RepID=UPI0015767F95|nr:DUF1178 family protein [Rhodoferax sp. BAB1]QKO22299.1 DUF1178 family protein [Rhodoferax sp. BAB1]
MKVFNLQCSAHHGFEGWFASDEDYSSQVERGLLECPLCADKTIHKLPSAPRLNFGAVEAPQAKVPNEKQAVVAGDPAQALQAAYLQLARRIVSETEDVGERFAEEARKIHYGETEERGIRGQASREETEALMEEGIAVMPLPLPEGLKGPLQ